LAYGFKWQYVADGIAVVGLNDAFLREQRFCDAWEFARHGNLDLWGGEVPDLRWRAHIAVWAAMHGLTLEGDFVECGVFGGLLSMTICKYLNFERVNKKFYLVDTYEGIPGDNRVDDGYKGTYPVARRNFSGFSNAIIVKGTVPEVLPSIDIQRVAYLSIDMNNAPAELGAMEFFWNRLSPGACVLFDDYGHAGFEAQQVALDEFAAKRGVKIATLPSKQGLLLKP
jgi:O-methyltransferase